MSPTGWDLTLLLIDSFLACMRHVGRRHYNCHRDNFHLNNSDTILALIFIGIDRHWFVFKEGKTTTLKRVLVRSVGWQTWEITYEPRWNIMHSTPQNRNFYTWYRKQAKGFIQDIHFIVPYTDWKADNFGIPSNTCSDLTMVTEKKMIFYRYLWSLVGIRRDQFGH